MGTSRFVEADLGSDDGLDTGFEDSAFSDVDNSFNKVSPSKARKTIEQLLEEKRLREMLYDDFDDSMEA